MLKNGNQKTVVLTGLFDNYMQKAACCLAEKDYDLFYIDRDVPEEFPGKCIKVDEDWGKAIDTFYASRRFIHSLVINPGVSLFYGQQHEITQIRTPIWEECVEKRLAGMFQRVKYFGKKMSRNRQGQIIILLSTLGDNPAAGSVAASVMDEALKALIKASAIEFGRYNVKLYGISLGYFPELQDLPGPVNVKKIPLRRAAGLSDFTGTLDVLLKNPFTYITGQIFYLNGGMA